MSEGSLVSAACAAPVCSVEGVFGVAVALVASDCAARSASCTRSMRAVSAARWRSSMRWRICAAICSRLRWRFCSGVSAADSLTPGSNLSAQDSKLDNVSLRLSWLAVSD